MKITKRPMLVTVLYGLVCGLSFVPTTLALSCIVSWPVAFRLTIWAYLALYLFFLTRWAKVSSLAVVFPLLLLVVFSFWEGPNGAFLVLALGILSWIRSGICFQAGVLKGLIAEVVICLGGGALLACFAPHSMLAWAMGIWMFFLVQSLYFVLCKENGEAEAIVGPDPFEQARNQAEEILSR